MSRFRNVSGALLLGGASRRMGRDKSRLPVAGVSCAARIAAHLDLLFEDVLLVGGDPLPDLPGRAVPDPEGPRCALRGLVAALVAARTQRVLVVATDLPLLTSELLLALVAWPERDAVVPRDAGGLHPLCALYRRDAVLPAARGRLATGKLALRGLLDEVDTGFLEAEDLKAVDPQGTALLNVNTPEDRDRAESLLTALSD